MSSCMIDDELEAVQAVLSEDYKLVTDIQDKEYTHCFEAFCFPSDDLDDCHCSVHLRVKVPKAYPNKIPSIEILSRDGISANTANNLLRHLEHKLSEQLQQEMLYDLIDLTKGYLQQYNFIGANVDETCTPTAKPEENTQPEGQAEVDEQHVTGDQDAAFDDEFDNDDDDDNAGWGDLDEYEEDATLTKSLQSIERLMEHKENEMESDSNKKQKKQTMKYDELRLQDVIEEDMSSARLMAVADVFQLAMSNRHFYGECRVLKDGKNTFEIRIGVQMSQYIQTKEVLNVLGLWQDDYMVIRLQFSKQYINDANPPKIIEIGKSVPHKQFQQKKTTPNANKDEEEKEKHGTPIKLKNKLQPFVGSRSIMNRINNKLFARLWPPTDLHKYRPSKYKEILKLMTTTGYSYDDCKAVLYHLKQYEAALLYLTQHDEETKGGTHEGADLNAEEKIKKLQQQDNEITAEMSLLCEQLISYGKEEIYQHKQPKQEQQNSNENTTEDGGAENDDGDEGENKDAAEEEEKCNKRTFENETETFLRNTANYFMHNVLMQILYFAMHSTLTLSQRCLVCDIKHPSNPGLIKPTVCKNTLCMYGYEELEIGLDVASIIVNTPEVVDLLITFCFVAAKKGTVRMYSPLEVHAAPPNEHINFKKKWKQSSSPYVYQQKKPNEYNVLDEELLLKVLAKMPSIDSLMSSAKKGGNKNLKKSLTHKSPLLWPLLRWLIVTNRSYLIPLRNKHEQFDGIPSCVQFKFVSYSPEREYLFQELSRKNNDCGTVWAWHGSRMSNWHCILRTGLKNMSGTKHMRNGAAFGRGIYLAPMSGTSYWYCEPSRSDTWPLSMFNKSDYYGRTISTNVGDNVKHTGHGLYCLALCEILNHPKLKSPEPYYVVPTESWVMTRYLFVFNTVDNKYASNNWRGKGRYFDIEANKCMQNYLKKQQQLNAK